MQDWSALIESTVPLTPKSVGLLGGNVVRGRVATTVRFEGLILIGLFPLPIPQGKPTACTLLTSPGTYSIHQVPNGRHYIFAAALESVQGRFSPLMNGDALRGRPQHGPIVVQDCQIAGSTDIVLRPAEVTDPPVLTVLPVLLSNLVESRADAAEPAAVYGYV